MSRLTVASSSKRRLRSSQWESLTASAVFREKRSIVFLIVILAFSTFWLTWKLSQPWNGLGGSNGALYSTVARNYMQYGFWQTRFGQATNSEQVTTVSDLKFYQHHPPLVSMLLAAAFWSFGESEATARLLAIVFTLGSSILVFFFTRRVYGESVGIIALFLFATFPGVLFFGRMPGFEAPSLFFILLSTWFYLRLTETQKTAYLLGLYVSLAAGLLMDWPVYFVVPLLSFHCWLYLKEARFRKTIVFGLPLWALLIFAVFQYQSYLVDPQSFKDLLYQGMAYMGLISRESAVATRFVEAKVTFTPLQYARRAVVRLDLLFSYPLLILAAVGLWDLRRTKGARERLVLTLLGVALAYSVVFYRSVFIHAYHTYYFSAPVALLAALGARAVFVGMRGEQVNSLLGKSALPLAFLGVLVIAGMLPRLKSLHRMQIKLLPGEQHESAQFLKTVAQRIREMSRDYDVILTNLPKSKAHSPVGYYSERKIVWNVDSVSSLETLAKSSGEEDGLHFLYWKSHDGAEERDELFVRLVEMANPNEFTVDEHRFLWFTLLPGVAAEQSSP